METLLMTLSARTFQILWIGSFATGMFFFVLQRRYSQGYLPKSPEAWLFFLLGWSFVVVAAISAGFYMKRRTRYTSGNNKKGAREIRASTRDSKNSPSPEPR
jgi:hypothetical protein